METKMKQLEELIRDDAKAPEGWRVIAVVNDDNMTYFVCDESSKEAIVVDPMREDWMTHQALARELEDYRFIAVIDTHTHADHVSNAAQLAERLDAPLVMHEKAPSRRVTLRVSGDTRILGLKLYVTPGHTQDCITPVFGPFVFGGDMLMYGDTGRDDLPTGDPTAHWESLQKLKRLIPDSAIFLPGHDSEGGRASSWKTQLEQNAAFSQTLDQYVADGGAWVGPAPKALKESLYENFK